MICREPDFLSFRAPVERTAVNGAGNGFPRREGDFQDPSGRVSLAR